MKFGELLVAAGIIQPEQLQEALEYQKKHKGRIGSILVKLNYISETELNRFLEVQLGVTAVDIKSLKIPPGVIRLISPVLAQRYKVIPLRVEGHKLVVAMADPRNLFALDDLKFATGMSQIKVMVASETSINEALCHYYGFKPEPTGSDEPSEQEKTASRTIERPRSDMMQLDDPDLFQAALKQINSKEFDEESQNEDFVELKLDEFDAPIVRIINLILIEAIERGISDIHIEGHEEQLKVRYRLDGLLHDIMTPPRALHSALISRIKVMADLDIAIRRRPQDGNISLYYDGRKVDFRVSTLPTVFGEKVVIRILDKSKGLIPLEKLGFDATRLSRVRSIVTQPQGILLVTGPTGSGKTSTLHSILNYIYTPTLNIVTVEDPVEYRFPGINHVNINERAGLTFSAALRSILRQDPDVVMVGEIRDRETAEIAIRAALTGHQVFSTLHTNSASETLTRLLDMDIDPYMIGSSLLAVIAQRLVRKVCDSCAIEYRPSFEEMEHFGITKEQYETARFRKGKGCKICNGSGYKGRMGIYELLEINKKIRELILRNASLEQIENAARENHFISLRNDGIQHVLAGHTTFEEVLRVTSKRE